MNNRPLVSIIIPTYNRAHLIVETLDSIIAQTYTNWECIIVDDGSKDNTDKILTNYCKKDNRFQYHHRPIDRLAGGNAARNYGFELSVGEYIVFMDSDDLLAKYCFKSRVSEMMKYDMDFIVFKTGKFSDSFNGTYLPFSNLEINNDRVLNLRNFLEFKIPWQTTSPIYKRKFIIKNKFDESLLRYQDYEFHIRLLLNKDVSFYCIDNVDNFYRQYFVDKENKTLKFNKEIAALSFVKVFNSLNPLLRHTEDKKFFKLFIFKILFNYVYNFNDKFESEIKSIHKELRIHKYITLFEQYYLYQLYFIMRFRLQSFRGVNRYYIHLKNKLNL